MEKNIDSDMEGSMNYEFRVWGTRTRQVYSEKPEIFNNTTTLPGYNLG